MDMEEDISERAGSSLHHRVVPESSLAQERIFFPSLGDEPNEVLRNSRSSFFPKVSTRFSMSLEVRDLHLG